MRILHVDTGKGWRGGQQQVLNLNKGLMRQGVETALIVQPDSELAVRAVAAGVRVVTLPLRGEWDLSSAFAIAREIEKMGATHLHLHSSHAHALGLIASMKARNVKVIVSRRIDLMPRSHIFNRWKYGAGVDCFVAISQAIKNQLVAFGIPDSKVRIVHSGVDPDKIKIGAGLAFRKELGLSPGEKLVGTIGQLDTSKGQRYLLEAIPAILENHPEARFVIAGKGPLEDELKALADSLGVAEKVVFTGFRSDVEAVMDALDLFVMASLHEGLGTIVVDALAAKKPVLVSRAGGLPEIVSDGIEGIVVEPKDSGAIAAGVSALLGDEELAQRYGEAGRAKVLTHFSDEVMTLGNLQNYRDLA